MSFPYKPTHPCTIDLVGPFPIYCYPTLISTDQSEFQITERDQREGEIFTEEFLGLGFTKPWEEEEP